MNNIKANSVRKLKKFFADGMVLLSAFFNIKKYYFLGLVGGGTKAPEHMGIDYVKLMSNCTKKIVVDNVEK